MIKRKTLFICFLFISLFVLSQKLNTDSLKLVLSRADDSTKCLILIELIENESNNRIWPAYNEELKGTAATYTSSNQRHKRMFFLKVYSDAINNDGYLFQERGSFNEALKSYRSSLEIKLDINDRIGAANTLGNIGYLYQLFADYQNAIKYYNKSLKIQEENNDKGGASTTLVNLASISLSQKDTTQYLILIQRALTFRQEVGDQIGIARCYNSLAIIEGKKSDKSLAFKYCNLALEIFESIAYKEGVGHTYNNLAALYSLTGDYQKSLELYFKALKINKEVQDHNNTATSLSNIADVYLSLKNVEKAKLYYDEAYNFAKQGGGLNELENICYGLYITNKRLNNSEAALNMLETYLQIKDSLAKKTVVASAFVNEDIVFNDSIIQSTEQERDEMSSVYSESTEESFNWLSFALILLGMTLLIIITVFKNRR